ncbi:hypothetical protein BJ944DRAFT_101408 [Cunninghamella echinulata]|nr:hypothetical protein BJ944DRAFT_101408 [Cunninghamella echinulata]
MTTASADWTVLERLLLAQAVNKFGEDDWFQVARTLKQHPLLQGQERPEAFNQKNCSLQYYLMIDNLETESRRQHKTPNNIPTQEMPNVVKLARQLYKQRVEDLKRSIKEDEEQFMKLISEIDDIKSGAWDSKLTTIANEQQQESNILSTNIEDTTLASDHQPSPMNIDEKKFMNDNNNNNNNNNNTISDLESGTLTSDIINNGDNTKEKGEQEKKVDEVDVQRDQEREMMEEKEKSPPTDNNVNIETKQIQLAPTSIPPVNENENVLEKKVSSPKPIGSDSAVTRNENISAATTSTETAIDADTDADTDKQKSTTTNLKMKEPQPEQIITNEPLETTVKEHGIKRKSDDTVNSQLDLTQESSETVPKKPRFEDHEQITSSVTPNNSLELKEDDNIVPVKIEHVHTNENLNEKSETLSEKNDIKSEATESNIPLYAISSSPPSTYTPASVSGLSDIESPVKSAKSDVNNEHSSFSSPSSSNVKIEPVSDQPGTTITENIDTSNNKSTANMIQDTDGTDSVTESNPPTPTTANEKRKSTATASKDDQRQKSWQKNVNLLWREIANHKNGAMFMNPIKEAQAPLYYDVVKYPMDLKTIKNRIRDGVIRTTAEFERDVILMLTNSLMYNKEGTEIYQMALEMLEDVTEQIKIFKTADGNSTANIRSVSLLKDKRKNITE